MNCDPPLQHTRVLVCDDFHLRRLEHGAIWRPKSCDMKLGLPVSGGGGGECGG